MYSGISEGNQILSRSKMKKAFTLIELVVAIALLAMVISFASVVFSVSIDSYRVAGANAEIMQRLRAVTDQLNTDFGGIRTDAPLLIWFQQDTDDPTQRFDQIMFFADGDFQSIQLYDLYGGGTGEPDPSHGRFIRGNVARIFYGQAQSLDPVDNVIEDPDELNEEDRLLARRCHILTADTYIEEWPDADMSDFDAYDSTGTYRLNEWYEHDSLSLAQWETVDAGDYGVVVATCFDFRPLVDMGDPNTFHKLMCEGLGSFAVQWAYWDSGDEEFYWFPSDDPDGDATTNDSDFDLVDDEFGVYFDIPGTIDNDDWYSIDDFAGEDFSSYPDAIKFTFTLYDSRGIIVGGRPFTHIVYIGD
jgi:prepilin-type N-terminal cleavage/methylation domain-containing protein